MLAVFKNPWVIGGAVVIGGLVLLSKSGGGSSGGPVDPFTANNSAALANVGANAAANAQIAMEQTRSNTITATQALKSLENMFQVQQVTAEKAFESQNGVFTTQIQSQNALMMDRSQNAARLDMAQITNWNQTVQRLAGISAQRDVATAGMQLDFMKSGMQAGIQTHQIDVSSRTAETIATLQAQSQNYAAQLGAETAVATSAMNNATAQKRTQAAQDMSIWGGLMGLAGKFLQGGFSPTSLSPLPVFG